MNKEVKNNKTHRNDSIPPQTPDVFLGNPVLDNVMSSVIALGSEFWSLQRRMNIIESALERVWTGVYNHKKFHSRDVWKFLSGKNFRWVGLGNLRN